MWGKTRLAAAECTGGKQGEEFQSLNGRWLILTERVDGKLHEKWVGRKEKDEK
jgi:hypothetical protein